jgi:hypothetical protein
MVKTFSELPLISYEIKLYKNPILMKVSDYSDFRVYSERLVFGEICGKFLAFNEVSKIENLNKTDGASLWQYVEEILPNYTVEELYTLIGHKFNIIKK